MNDLHKSQIRKISLILTLLLALTAAGTTVFYFVHRKPLVEAAYLSIITLTTLGSRDPADTENNLQMIFVMVYLSLGLGVFTYSLFSLGQSLVDAQVQQFWRIRRMEKSIDKLQGHYIICGQGRMGNAICEYLDHRDKDFVVIDSDEALLIQLCEERKWLYINGDATDDETLQRAGISHARALASVLPSDSDNVYVVLSARMLNSELQIVARASDDKAVEKIERAGATRVISPFSSGGIKMARFMISPSVEDFLEVTDGSGSNLELADIHVTDSSPYCSMRLNETNLRQRGIMVIGIRKKDGTRLLPPPGDAILEEGDSLFAFGDAMVINDMIGEDAIEETLDLS